MGCDQIREAHSAQLDGEDPGLAGAAVDAHLQGCRGCRAWIDGLTSVQRLARLRVAGPIPDLTARILATGRGRQSHFEWSVAEETRRVSSALDDSPIPTPPSRRQGPRASRSA